jgi:hypothetical protein
MDAKHRMFMTAVRLHSMKNLLDDAIKKCEKDDPLGVDDTLRLMLPEISQLQMNLKGPISREWIRIGINDYKDQLADKKFEEESHNGMARSSS